MSTYLERYLAGEHEQVWDDLVALGERIREEPLYSDAVAVAHETMRRVRHNLELIVARLRDLGYTFGYGWAVPEPLKAHEAAEMEQREPPLCDPAESVTALIEDMESRFGLLPLSLRAFYEVVGGVNLIGMYRTWDCRKLDPLDVMAVHVVLFEDKDVRWSDDRQEDGSCEVPIAPDEYFKYFYSGGGPYAIGVPAPVADARLRYEWHHTTFVAYLRECLRWGGFPGWARLAEWPAADIAFLTCDLLPI